ncbi:hypothetical protein Tlie_1597 [Thermovirga lienii DSM 17291]|jgi:flagellar biogenesis protein FliO|uniref:Uncharacterized protein n=1 Tax=Thermovirga lienii (strain ATCC BAA-1197 / DSM 17291 / Cas60314) TaxID=580340 RepID=G7V7R5_THELD|nr:hypothetical protein Tlie_1597 [Thermovirga lienii DSM 17291]MDN5318657.1 hypothetical protein [Thermovirga sp.]MDN5367792.1 hypothetical protein [Thermovirga sp.]
MHQTDGFVLFSMLAILAGILFPIWILITDRGENHD